MGLTRSCRWLIGAAVLALATSGCSFIARVTVASDGTQANVPSGFAGEPLISGSGRYSLYTSSATNLVAGDTNGKQDVFRHDNTTGATVRVSLDSQGTQISADSGAVGISDDGTLVAFSTSAPLAAGDQHPGFDLYVRNIDTGAVELASLRPDGSPLPSPHLVAQPVLSANGRYLAFYDLDPGSGNGLTEQVLVRDLLNDTTTALGTPANKNGLTISGDGKHVADARLCDPTCASPQVLEVFDWQGVTYPHVPTNASVADQSTDGRYLLWYPVQGMSRFDRVTGASSLVGGGVFSGTMSGDGRVVVFPSNRTDLVPGDSNGAPDYFAVDVLSGAIRRANVSAIGGQADQGDTGENLPPAALDTVGRSVAFSSRAANLVPDDTDGFLDGFVADAALPMPTSVTPSNLSRGAQHVVVTLAGGFLLANATYDFGAGVTVESVSHRTDGSQRLTVSVAPDAPVGARDVTVRLPGSMGAASGTCSGCMTIS
jgi:hypothetical protein